MERTATQGCAGGSEMRSAALVIQGGGQAYQRWRAAGVCAIIAGLNPWSTWAGWIRFPSCDQMERLRFEATNSTFLLKAVKG